MPGPIVDLSATVMCMHAGLATPLVPSTRVFVSDQPIITLASPYAVAGCTLAAALSPFCVVGTVIAGATRVFAEGMPLVLLSSQSICAAPGTPLLFLVTQVRANAA